MAQEPFRITPTLGPDLWQTETQFYWDTVTDPAGTGAPSYPLGTLVTGNDGHLYRYVKAGAGFAKDAGVEINESTNVATLDESSPQWTVPVAVSNGDLFHARSVVPLPS